MPYGIGSCWGQDPVPSLLILVFCIVLPPLVEDLWPVIVSIFATAFLARVWLWCRGPLPDDTPEPCPDDIEGSSEYKSREKP